MSTIDAIKGINSSTHLSESNGVQAKAPQDMGKDDFLKLLVTQIQNQNPMEPQENGEFLAQMAQLGTVDGITQLNRNFEALTHSLQSNQALQASALVGRKVLVPSQQAMFNGQENVKGVVDLTQSVNDLTVQIFNTQGELVRTEALGMKPKGEVHFAWDGRNSLGQMLPLGLYNISATATVDNQSTAMKTYLGANVDSVSLGQGGSEMTLNVAGVGPIAYSQIKEIMN